jgi:hypothetical protein
MCPRGAPFAIALQSRERGWSCPETHENQALDNDDLSMWKSCGKRCADGSYSPNSIRKKLRTEKGLK